MKMLVTIKRFLFVISIVFLSLVQSNPVKLIDVEMVHELSNCTYLPEEVKLPESPRICGEVIPNANDSKFVKYFLNKYMCMELRDVCLQLCDAKFASANFPKMKEDFKIMSFNLNVESFCSELTFSDTRNGKTQIWADFAIVHLKNSKNCEKYCVDGVELHPLCRAIFWANQYLITAINIKDASTIEVSTTSDNASEAFRHVPDVETKAGPIAKEHASTAELSTVNTIAKNVVMVDTNPKNEYDRTETAKNPQMSDQSSSVNPTTQLKNEKLSEKPSPPEPPSSPSVSPTIPPTVSESSNKLVENSVEEHENTGTSKSSVIGDDESSVPEYDATEVESKGSFAEGPLSPSVPQEDNYGAGEADEASPGVVRSFNELQGEDTFVDAQDSHFFAYFLTMVVICIVGYLVFHNKQKIIALALEGRRMQGSRRRPNTSSYKKLDSNLEEAVTSTCSSSSVTHVIF